MEFALVTIVDKSRLVARRLPIFLVFGLPRSRTTWLGKIFDSQPDTLYRHEPNNHPRLAASYRRPGHHLAAST
jgi:hypothetical protein